MKMYNRLQLLFVVLVMGAHETAWIIGTKWNSSDACDPGDGDAAGSVVSVQCSVTGEARNVDIETWPPRYTVWCRWCWITASQNTKVGLFRLLLHTLFCALCKTTEHWLFTNRRPLIGFPICFKYSRGLTWARHQAAVTSMQEMHPEPFQLSNRQGLAADLCQTWASQDYNIHLLRHIHSACQVYGWMALHQPKQPHLPTQTLTHM